MSTVHGEVVANYDADAGFRVPNLVELFGAVRGHGGVPPADGVPWAEGEQVEHRLTATYFDTGGLDLAAAGLTLRRRTGGADAGWHLKVPAGHQSRSEVRVPLDHSADDAVPDELLTMTYARTLGQPLVPVAQITTVRTVRRLIDPTGRALVEVADDRVTAHRLSPDDHGSADGTVTWREIEVELVDGPPGLLAAIDPVLRQRGLTPASASSKLVRTLGQSAVEATAREAAKGTTGPRTMTGKGTKGKGKPSKSVTAGDVALARIAAQVHQIRAQDLPVRLDHPGAVHAMRVASRRLRSALTTFDPLFHSAQTRPAGRELKWLAGVLGAARDAEVMRDRLTAATAQEGHDARLKTTVDREVGEELDHSYRTAHDDVLAQLDSQRYRDLLDTLAGLVDQPPLKTRGHRPAREELPRLVGRSYTALRWSMEAAHGSADPVEREELLHDARKAAKRARYAAEAVVPVFGVNAQRFATAMENVQEALGEHLEAMNARARLHDLAAHTSDPSTAFTYGRLHAHEEFRAERSGGQVEDAWSAASTKALRRWLR